MNLDSAINNDRKTLYINQRKNHAVICSNFPKVLQKQTESCNKTVSRALTGNDDFPFKAKAFTVL